ncbi:MAG: hypothetical protein ABI162_06865 [Luteolibacter sp.]
MATATVKHPALDAWITSNTGIDRVACIEAAICPFCKSPAFKFTDELSRREHAITGLCQDCQDAVFA